eukprot:NODE_290_length_10614_cov_1.553590.p9 type:complete len:166 gc:universal NODE_290_length_10614_cov_1.553590:6950-6453(-)
MSSMIFNFPFCKIFSNMSDFLFAPAYGYCVATASTLAFHCYSQGFYISKLRREFGLNYPDVGSGRYSDKLTDEQWVKFNCYQRAHHNYLEQIPMTLVWLLVGGIKYPEIATGLGLSVFVGRQLYVSGYRKKGPQGRKLGGYVSSASMLGLFVTSIVSALKIAKAF